MSNNSPSLPSLRFLPFHPKHITDFKIGICTDMNIRNSRFYLPALQGIHQSQVSQDVLLVLLILSLHWFLANLVSPGNHEETSGYKSQKNIDIKSRILFKKFMTPSYLLTGKPAIPGGPCRSEHRTTWVHCKERPGSDLGAEWVPVVQVGLWVQVNWWSNPVHSGYPEVREETLVKRTKWF